jgi:hypothetical protein
MTSTADLASKYWDSGQRTGGEDGVVIDGDKVLLGEKHFDKMSCTAKLRLSVDEVE